ncbi:MAG: hypothetical protein CMA86_03715 [Euryarchaeota archaeon]|nr:hypothetical protein [Euryarchaeota archaeon]
MRFKVVLLVVLLGLMPLQQIGWQELSPENEALQSPSNPTGVDVTVEGYTVAYTNNADADSYRMFSSNDPGIFFNRPAELYVIDGMVNVSVTITATVENIGTASSGVIDVRVVLLHNEYSSFEIVNQTVQMASLNGGSSNTASVNIVPSYAGNHTIVVSATSTVSDDVPSNDAYSKGFTVGYAYFNCDSSAAWSFGSGWSMSTDTSISKGLSCHVGNGQFSSYTNNMQASLTTPIMDLSDAINNPTRTNGLSFFYTGSAANNDKLTMYGRTALGGWSEIGSFTGTIDQDFTDSANWQTFSVNNKGANSPLVPVAQDLFHSSSQFKFEFTSDASGTDMGYWLDDIVIMYDQKIRPSEYNVSAQGVSTNGATAGSWGSVSLNIINTGNISETFIPELTGLPASWNAYFQRSSGSSFDPTKGLYVPTNSPVQFTIMIQPSVTASLGFHQMSIQLSSQSYPGVTTTLPVQFLVMADRIPVVTPPDVRPSCPPSHTCTFEVDFSNEGGATDVFDIIMDTSQIPNGWTVAMAWSQHSSVLIRPNETVSALFTMTVPEDAAPDTVVEFDITLQSQNDTARVDTKEIQISASMVSEAAVDLVASYKLERTYVDAGGSLVLRYEIWNNATRQDIFSMRVEAEGSSDWVVHQPTRTQAVLNPGMSTTFEIQVDVPENAQANDRGPAITPIIESQRSLMTIEGQAYDGIRVTTTNDVTVSLLSAPTKLTPGIANEVLLQVTNNGNGPADVTLHPMDIPETWTWWLSVDGTNTSEPISLSVSYDLEHEATVSLWVLLNMSEAAGELHTLGIEAKHVGDGEDANRTDNVVEFTASTAAVRVPSLHLGEHSTSVMAGDVMYAESILQNDGNAVENRLSVTASVSSVPPIPGLVVFFTVDGGDRPVADSVDLMVPAGQNSILRLEVLIPQDAPLNTRFVLRFDIDGAVDEEGLPNPMMAEALVMLDKQRSMDVDVVRSNNLTVQHGTAAQVWVNHTSTSSMMEDYALRAEQPEGWQITCNKRLLNETGETYTLSAGHVTPQLRNHGCEILRLSGPLEGTVTFTISSDDGVLSTRKEMTIAFSSPPSEEGYSSVVLAGGGIGIVLTIACLMFFLRPRVTKEDVFDEVMAETTMAGPPVSQPTQTLEASEAVPDETQTHTAGPPLPAEGLPPGWSEEQWAYYGQQYLDGTL